MSFVFYICLVNFVWYLGAQNLKFLPELLVLSIIEAQYIALQLLEYKTFPFNLSKALNLGQLLVGYLLDYHYTLSRLSLSWFWD